MLPKVINEFRAGLFRNRNNSEAYYHTNAEFGIASPIDPNEVPDLSQINIGAGSGDTAAGGAVRFGSLADGTRIFDL